ncbi:MAG: hypothetical protein NVSMB68_03240 [Thermoanaerobaculia bacterium]
MIVSRWMLCACVVLAFLSVPARAENFGVDLLGALVDPVSSGNIRHLDATVTYSPKFRPEAIVTLFLRRSLAISVSETRGRVPLKLTQDGAAPGTSSVFMMSRTAVLKVNHTLNGFEGYAGAGIALPTIRSLRPEPTSGSLTLVRFSSPDHAALVVNLGAAYRITSRLRLVGDVKYEPFPSTAEVRRSEYPDDDLESNFHLLVVASGISLRF